MVAVTIASPQPCSHTSSARLGAPSATLPLPLAPWQAAQAANFELDEQISYSVGMDASGALVVYGDENGLVTLLNLLTNERTVVGIHDEQIAYAGITPDGSLAVALDTSGTLNLWEIPDAE